MSTFDIAPFIEAESDRIVGDDLIAGPQTHTVARIEGIVDEKKKKRLVLHMEGTQKPFIPCKGMARLLGHLWGPDAAKWVGRTMVLYRDPDVRFGADATGGVRICSVSDIDKAVKVPIRTSQKSVKTFDVEPFKAETKAPANDPAARWADAYVAKVDQIDTPEALKAFDVGRAGRLAELEAKRPELFRLCADARDARRGAMNADPGPAPDDFADAEWAQD